jgi:hypothetical protein
LRGMAGVAMSAGVSAGLARQDVESITPRSESRFKMDLEAEQKLNIRRYGRVAFTCLVDGGPTGDLFRRTCGRLDALVGPSQQPRDELPKAEGRS